jgi:archaellin
MSLETLVPEARSALTGNSALTALVPANRITFARRPQGDVRPGIAIDLGPVEYTPSTTNPTAVITYRVDYLIYGDTAAQTTAIHEKVKSAIESATSSTFYLRIFDEDYFVDVDDVHRSRVMVNYEVSTQGNTPSTINYITNSLSSRVEVKTRIIASGPVDDSDWLSDDLILQVFANNTNGTLPAAVLNKNRVLGLYYHGTSGELDIDVENGGTIDGAGSLILNTTTRFAAVLSLDQSGVSQSEPWAWKTIWKQ